VSKIESLFIYLGAQVFYHLNQSIVSLVSVKEFWQHIVKLNKHKHKLLFLISKVQDKSTFKNKNSR